MIKKYIYLLLLLLFFSCGEDENDGEKYKGPREIVMIDKGIYKVSYNEIYEQPNWIEYTVSNRPKNVDRGNKDFYLESGVHTSNDADYYKNEWDKGHMAPTGSFTDSWSNLAKTFSFVNCALQLDDLNRGEWRELEEQVRDWARDLGPVNVRIELKFSPNSSVLETGATVPDGFYKFLTFSDNFKKCYYFDNASTDKDWTEHEIGCN